MTYEPTERDHGAAKHLAEEVRKSDGRRRTWRKVTTLLTAYGVHRLTPAVRERIDSSLRSAGLVVEPSMMDVSRSGTVRLSTVEPGDATQRSGRASPAVSRGLIRVTFWGANGMRTGSLQDSADPDEIAWYDLDIVDGLEDDAWRDLRSRCRGLDKARIRDLFTADEVPGVESVGSHLDLRAVSIAGVNEVRETVPTEAGAAEVLAEQPGLEFNLVEVLAGDGWLVTAWHEGQAYFGSSVKGGGRPKPKRAAEFEPLVVADWNQGALSSSGDLGTILLRHVAVSYAEAYRDLYSWLDSWDGASGSEDPLPASTLSDLRALASRFRKQLTGLAKPGEPTRSAWFRGLSPDAEDHAFQIGAVITLTLRELRDFAGEVQERTLEAERQRNDRFQVLVATAGGLVLVPTLVASVFGANTSLPGESSWFGFFLLLGVMLVSMVIAAFAIRRWRQRQSGRHDQVE